MNLINAAHPREKKTGHPSERSSQETRERGLPLCLPSVMVLKEKGEEREEAEAQKNVKSPKLRGTRSKRNHKDVLLSPETAAERSQKKGKQ